MLLSCLYEVYHLASYYEQDQTNIFGFQFVFLQPFPCSVLVIIDLFLFALLSFVCHVLTDSSSLVIRLTEECHRSDGEHSLDW